ncbi:MAG: hypothetical protein DWI29_04275 [Planctomycetota bacterium]|nr:MAG: hypothetical protein DWI29_04275 [Planctomycetota bacterium]
MSEQLSDNIEEWPVSPFEVLGLPRTAERTEIRRAYSALIRRFRPETHPKQFQRVRESFEAAMAALEVRSQNSGDIRIDLTTLVAHDDAATTPSSKSPFSTIADSTTSTDDAELVWDRFSDAPDAIQYEEIRRLTQSSKSSADAFLMAYWMLRLRPDFSPGEKAAEWLIRGISSFGADPRLIDLLVDEFRRDADLTEPQNSGDTAGYILSSDLLCIYLIGRWNIIGQKRRWKQLADEVDRSRVRLAMDHSEAWSRLLFRVYEMVAFANDAVGGSLLESVQKEVGGMNLMQQRHLASLDTLDMLSEFRKHQYDVWLSGSPALHQLLLESTNLSSSMFRRQLFGVIEGWIDSPLEALNCVTSLAVKLPEAFWLLLRQVDGLGFFDDPHSVRDSALLETVGTMVTSCKHLEYAHARIVIAEFCRDECVSGTTMMGALVSLNDTVSNAGPFAAALQQDTPLLLTCQLICRFLEATGPTIDTD